MSFAPTTTPTPSPSASPSGTTSPLEADHPYRSAPGPRPFDPEGGRVPYDGQRHLRLTIGAGLAHARIVVDPAARDLLVIEGGPGPRPRLQLTGDQLTVTWHASFRERLCSILAAGNVFTAGLSVAGLDELTLVLHPAVEWELAIRGGLSHVALELSAGAVARVDLGGGCSHVALDLPAPAARTPIRVAGGASHLRLRRPAETGVSLAVDGGLCKLQLDDRRLDAIGGAAQLDSRNFSDAAPHYDLTIRGGASDLAIERR
jgi:hypothetical protein